MRVLLKVKIASSTLSDGKLLYIASDIYLTVLKLCFIILKGVH